MRLSKHFFIPAAFFAALFTTGFFTGCSKPAAVVSGPANVSILLSGDNTPNAQNMVLDELGKKTNTVIEMIYVPSADRNTKLSTMVAGGTPPDIFGTDANTAKEFKEAGLLAEVGKYLNTLGPNILADAGDILSACPVNKDGIYMILSGSMGGADQLNLRTDWLKNLGLEMPTDLDSLYNVFYAFTYKDPNGSGKQDTYGLAAQTNLRSFSTIFGAYGIPQSATIIKDDNTLTTWVKHPQFLDAITYIRKLIADGLVEPDWATIPQMDMFGKLWNGVAGAMEWECVGPTNNWMPARYTEPVPPTFGFPIIRGPQGKHGVPKVFQSVTGGYVISSKADVEAALRIADYCKTPEASDLLYLGVEGVMYQWTDKANGKFEYLGDYADASTHRAAGGFCYWDLFVPANNAQLRTLNKQTQDGVAQAYAEGLDNTALIVADLRTRIDYGADMDQVIREMYAELLTTRGNLQTVYNRYMREWESAGGAEWEKEVNEAWKAQGGKNS